MKSYSNCLERVGGPSSSSTFLATKAAMSTNMKSCSLIGPMVLYVSAVDELHIGLGHWQQPKHSLEACKMWRDALV